MRFNGPELADLLDVRSLNIAFLEYLRGAAAEPVRAELPASLRPAVCALTDRHIARLAEVPFLLLTLRESDDAYWSRMLVDSPVQDLFACSRAEAEPLTRIASAALAFLWQLARRNPYAARLVSGSSLHWCDQLAASTLVKVLQYAAENEALIGPRLADNSVFWRRLLGSGLSSASEVRRAAHLASLQTILAPPGATRAHRFRSAACYSSVPTVEFKNQS